MSNKKDKLIEVIRASGYGYFITHKAVDVEDCLKATADSIIANLPELLADSNWVRLPAKIGETIYYTSGDEIKQLIIRKIRLNGDNYITYFGYDPNNKNRKELNVYECYRITEAEAEAKLAKLKGAKENE